MIYDIDVIPPKISGLIPEQFPPFYLEEDPLFVSFMVAYYQWLQTSNNPLYFQRNFLKLTDVDETTFDQFLVLIKEKYLKNIKLNTRSNIRQIIKHATDIYRSKGSERAIDLLFRLVFEEAVEFYYPKIDLFKASDGVWFKPKYLELSLSYNNRQLFHKKIVGLQSGATAFVDSVIRRSFNNRLIDLAYISAIDGNFITGEVIQPIDQTLSIKQCPMIIGSLSTIIVSKSGAHFSVGDIVNIESDTGDLASGRISVIEDATNQMDAEVLEGGYGYAISSNVMTSNVVLHFMANSITNAYARSYSRLLETFNQPMARINFINATDSFTLGDMIQTYYANNDLKGSGQIIAIEQAGANGIITASIISGDLDQDPFFNTANVIAANVDVGGYLDFTANGQFIGVANVTLNYTTSNAIGTFVTGEQLIQYNEPIDNTYPYVIGTVIQHTSNTPFGHVRVRLENGVYFPGRKIYGLQSNAIASVNTISLLVGLININGTFVNLANNFCYNPSISGHIHNVSSQLNAKFYVVNNLSFAENVDLNSDLLADFANVELDAEAYGFDADPTANSANTIEPTMTFANVSIGKITGVALQSISPLVQTDLLPIIVVHEPRIYTNKLDYLLQIANATTSFTNGEVVLQSDTNARGLIVGGNSSVLRVQNMRYYSNNSFVVTTNTSTTITGDSSGAVANLITIDYFDDPYDTHMGFNARFLANTIVANGVVTEVQVLDSGFGFIDNESVRIYKSDTSDDYRDAFGIATLKPPGVGAGYYKQKGGFLSSQKKLFDGFYWQEYSYEILSSRTRDKYYKLIKDLVHVAGVALFGRLVHKAIANSAISVSSSLEIIQETGINGAIVTTSAGELTVTI